MRAPQRVGQARWRPHHLAIQVGPPLRALRGVDPSEESTLEVCRTVRQTSLP